MAARRPRIAIAAFALATLACAYAGPGAATPSASGRLTSPDADQQTYNATTRGIWLDRFRFRSIREHVGKAEMFAVVVTRPIGGDLGAMQVALEQSADKVHRSRPRCSDDNDESCETPSTISGRPCFWSTDRILNDPSGGLIRWEDSPLSVYCPLEIYVAWYEMDGHQDETIDEVGAGVQNVRYNTEQLFVPEGGPHAPFPQLPCGLTPQSSLADVVACILSGVQHTPQLVGVFHTGGTTPHLTPAIMDGCIWKPALGSAAYGDIGQTAGNKTAQVEFGQDYAYNYSAASNSQAACGCPDTLRPAQQAGAQATPASEYDLTQLAMQQVGPCDVRFAARFANTDLTVAYSTPIQRTLTVYIDSDRNPATGSPDPVSLGADVRVELSTDLSGGPVTILRQIAWWVPQGWNPQAAVPRDVTLGQCNLAFTVNLQDVRSPADTVLAWATASNDRDNIVDVEPALGAQAPLALPLSSQFGCPIVKEVDKRRVERGLLNNSIRIGFSESIQPFTAAQVAIHPPQNFSVVMGTEHDQAFLAPAPEWSPGLYHVTLAGAIHDCIGGGLAGTPSGACGTGTQFDLCIPDTQLVLADGNGTPTATFAPGQPIYVQESRQAFFGSTVTAYVVDANILDHGGAALVDQTDDGPNVIPVTLERLALSPVGKITRPGRYVLVIDVNQNGVYDSADVLPDACHFSLLVTPDCDADLDAAPIAAWPLDETTRGGSTAEIARGLDGQVSAGTDVAAGQVGHARSFDGVSGEVRVPADDELDVGTDDFSLTAWVRMTNADGRRPVLQKKTGAAGYGLSFVYGSPTLELTDASGASTTGPPMSVVVNQWLHVAATVTHTPAAVARIYLNGTLVQTTTMPTGSGDLTNAADLVLGGDSAPGGDHFAGALDHVELWDGALSPGAIAILVRTGQAGLACPDTTQIGTSTSGGSGPGDVRPPDIYDDIPYKVSRPIRFALTHRAHVRAALFDVRGRRLRTLCDEFRSAGPQAVSWDGRDEGGRAMPSGVYFLRLELDGVRAVKGLVYVR